jgi:Skp family chaperone for outer membrane proteins
MKKVEKLCYDVHKGFRNISRWRSFCMRTSLSLFVFMFIGCVFWGVTSKNVQADNPVAGNDLSVATIDVAKLFRLYKPVMEKMEQLKQEVKILEEKMAIRQVEIESLQRRLQSPASTEDRERMQLQMAKLQTELRLFVERERGGLQKRESAMQVEFYKRVREIVSKISKERGLKLVLVRPELSLDTNNLVETQRALNAIILYEDGLEITDDVLKILNEELTAQGK